MNDESQTAAPTGKFIHITNTLMAVCLGVMALSVFVNVVLRYGFGSGVAGSEELSRLLFVWMVFIGATAAYPLGEHMAFTSLLELLRSRPAAMRWATALVRSLVLLGCVMVGWGAWQQVVVGMDSTSVVLHYRVALLPLPAFLCAVAIGVMALVDLIKQTPMDLDRGAEVE